MAPRCAWSLGWSWVLRKVNSAQTILEHRYARHSECRQYEPLNPYKKTRLLDHVSKRHVLCLRGGECDALLCPKINKLHKHQHTLAGTSYTRSMLSTTDIVSDILSDEWKKLLSPLPRPRRPPTEEGETFHLPSTATQYCSADLSMT